MGFGIVPDIKDEAVVCQKPCEHIDCKASREHWGEQSKCRICGEKFIKDQRFYYEDKLPVHALCIE